jgi:NhaA family Na+:H+ antiporter
LAASWDKPIDEAADLGVAFSDRVVLGVIAGLVIGKFLGVFDGARRSVRPGLAKPSEVLHGRDMSAMPLLVRLHIRVRGHRIALDDV